MNNLNEINSAEKKELYSPEVFSFEIKKKEENYEILKRDLYYIY